MIQTSLCELLGIEYPIFQGGMAWVSESVLAAAVTNAGGLGIISAMNADGEYLRREINRCRAAVGDKPFGVNIMLLSPHVEEIARVVIEEKVPVITTGAGMPPSQYMKDWIAAGIKVIPVVPSIAVAKFVVRMGAVAVVAEGCEAGGHIGELTTMTLVPLICDAVSVPVIAAGGIADGRGLAAALMLGAQGVQCGTRFLTSVECQIHENYKTRVLRAKDIDSMVSGRRLGHPVRALRSKFMRTMMELEYDTSISNAQIEQMGSGSLRKAVMDGDEEEGTFMAGQSAALVNERLTCQEIIVQMFTEGEQYLKEAAKWVK